MWLGLDRVDKVRELDGILDEEHRHIVANQVVVALPRVELDGKAAHITCQVRGAAGARYGGEASEHGRLRTRALQKIRRCVVGQRFVQLKVAVGGGTARMDHSLGNALMVEVSNLLAQQEILQQRRAAHALP